MLKMMLDPMGGITMTNDGNAILREVDVKHPAGKYDFREKNYFIRFKRYSFCFCIEN